jgi:hypothetical protein
LGNASLAAVTAELNSAGVHSGKRETTSWVAGLMTSKYSLALDSTGLLLMKSFTVSCFRSQFVKTEFG